MIVTGVVVDFNEQRGSGTVLSDSGESFYFHCVAIGDGSRTIDVGVRVRARRQVGHLGYDEVDALERLQSSS